MSITEEDVVIADTVVVALRSFARFTREIGPLAADAVHTPAG